MEQSTKEQAHDLYRRASSTAQQITQFIDQNRIFDGKPSNETALAMVILFLSVFFFRVPKEMVFSLLNHTWNLWEETAKITGLTPEKIKNMLNTEILKNWEPPTNMKKM